MFHYKFNIENKLYEQILLQIDILNLQAKSSLFLRCSCYTHADLTISYQPNFIFLKIFYQKSRRERIIRRKIKSKSANNRHYNQIYSNRKQNEKKNCFFVVYICLKMLAYQLENIL